MKSQKQTIFNIHGAGPKHYRSLQDGSGDWQAKLPKVLGNNYKYLAPQMPSPTKPDYNEWMEMFEKYLTRVRGEEVIFIGHSLGGSFLLKYLSENQIKYRIAGLFLVAAPFSSITGFEAPTDYSALLKIPNIYLYHSMDDVEVPYAHALMYRDRLHATLRTYSDRGHFFKRGDFSYLTNDIQTSTSEMNLNW